MCSVGSRWLCGVVAALALALGVRPAAAKTTHQSPYTYEQTYGSALRLVKVDLGLTITEQDSAWGYLLFEYTSRESGSRKTRGSFEFVRGRDGVQVWVQLPTMPSYHERMIVDKLARKLSEEHGAPPARPPTPKPKPGAARDGDKPPPDGNAKGDGGTDEGSGAKGRDERRREGESPGDAKGDGRSS
jgi:hypothetical protein